ncbi:AAA family ATPase [Mesomycoplasma ovipneumoniae]|uniref:AAA family ATPase n=1 Tax=Mesomycoplasma ovipneumoniae TaxID=29562 RepID=UPI0026E40684|nr:AAA family ATPase [Mesomycoplasma ovipneumoniae]MDO6829437.1 AAA family ATPase [Mesomycoplasma ovipneumoniae]
MDRKTEKQKVENIAEKLTEEQENVVNLALKGKNVLVDACIGSGKTSVIQVLCDKFPIDKKILYLTYNKLLKVDAKNKIKKKNVTVQNYHGFAYWFLWRNDINSSSADAIRIFLENNISVGTYDVLLIDEYQDITDEISLLLEKIKQENPNIQIVAVGDMSQKIYDNTKLKVIGFIDKFLGSYEKISLTISFRMPKEHADMLGRIWDKTIKGVNENCQIEYMELDQIKEFLSKQKPSDILCLGKNRGQMSKVLNYLEGKHKDIFNKDTVYASISDAENNLDPEEETAIFTTFDKSKGLERPICVIFDFTESYWFRRLEKIASNYEILRSLFCVAASRGKEKIIFVEPPYKVEDKILDEDTLIKSQSSNHQKDKLEYSMSTMFQHNYGKDIIEMRQMLDVEQMHTEDKSEIEAKNRDGQINLTPCAGIFLEASYFNDWQIDKTIRHFIEHKYNYSEKKQKQQIKKYENYIKERNSKKDLTLYLVYLQTDHDRYIDQTEPNFVDDNAIQQMNKRLSEDLSRNEKIQQRCLLEFNNNANNFTMNVRGIADVIKDDIVYELKFVRDLTTAHFLQTASYMLALNLETGILWNVKKNEKYKIKIKNRENFRVKLAETISKGWYKEKNLNQNQPKKRSWAIWKLLRINKLLTWIKKLL